MSERMIVRCWNPQQAHQAMSNQIWPMLKAHLVAGRRMVLELRPATRSTEQNAKLHAMLGDIAKQIEWAGKKRDIETWKRLLVAAWSRATGEPLEYLPAVDGHGVDIVFRRTSQMTVGEVGELIEFIYAWGAEAGVVFTETDIDPETGEIVTYRRAPAREAA